MRTNVYCISTVCRFRYFIVNCIVSLCVLHGNTSVNVITGITESLFIVILSAKERESGTEQSIVLHI